MQILLVLIGLALLYLALSSPRLRRKGFCAPALLAHRGLFDNGNGVPENSLPAFQAACEGGYAIELDVHLTADGQLIVFHDEGLMRACSAAGDPRRMTLDALRQLRLFGTGERIPTLDEVLDLVDGRAPLLIELKTTARYRELTIAAMQRLRRYQGPYLFESFNPLMLHVLRRRDPMIPRGQLVTRHSGESLAWRAAGFVLGTLMTNCLSRPDFIAYDAGMDNSFTIWVQRRLFRTPLCAWTVRSPEQYERLRDRAQMIIFEGFLPADPKSRSSGSREETSTP